MIPSIDPVCGMKVDLDRPKGGKTIHQGRELGFCSPGCKARFEADPEQYLQRRGPAASQPVAPGTRWVCPMDPEVISQLLARRSRRSPLSALTPREREVLAAMAEGQANAAIARRLVITEKAVGKHIAGIFARLNLPPSGDDHRRVLAVLAYLNATRP